MSKQIKPSMASNGNPETSTSTGSREIAAPKGYEEVSSDLVGFWDPDSLEVIEFTPLWVTLSTTKIKNSKNTSALLHCKATRPFTVKDRESGDSKQCETGDLVGIWLKPGMRDLELCCEAPVAMAYVGEKEVGQPSPMKVFKVWRKPGFPEKRIAVTRDSRLYKDQSLPFPLILPPDVGHGPTVQGQPEETELVPF